MKLCLILAPLIFIFFSYAKGQGLSGLVKDAKTGEPLILPKCFHLGIKMFCNYSELLILVS